MGALVLTIKIHRDERQLVTAKAGDEQPVTGIAELRIRPAAGDQCWRAAAGADHINAGVFRIFGCRQIAAAALLKRNGASIAAEARHGIVAGLACDHARVTAIGLRDHNLAQPFIAPADIGKLAAIAAISRP